MKAYTDPTMTYGLVKSRMLAYVIVMAALVCLYVPYWKGPFEFNQLFFQTPAILMLITLNRDWQKEKHHRSKNKNCDVVRIDRFHHTNVCLIMQFHEFTHGCPH